VILKICGATTPGEVALLADAGVDLVGLWHGVPGGRADLPADSVATLAGVARTRLQPVLVTLLGEPGALVDVIARTGVRWVQLHAYQPPALVRTLKAADEGLTVVKVLHIQGGTCLERPLIRSYERAGVDLFLLDAATRDGRIGSTGQRLAGPDVISLADRLSRPFLLAGGISAANRPDFGDVVGHPRFAGVDVDTAARDADGRIRSERVAAIRRHWDSTCSHEEATT
jgi:phosphoribosylanthranilate isomerase